MQKKGTLAWGVIGIVVSGVMLFCLALMFLMGIGGIAWYFLRIPPTIQVSASGSDNLPEIAQVGALAPGFKLSALDHGRVSLEQYHGHPILINFWTTWCGPCIEEMPLIQEQYGRYAPDLIVLAVNEGDPIQNVSDFVDENGYTFPVLMDTDYQVGDLYRVIGYPMSFFVDPNGIVRAMQEGSISAGDLDGYLLSVGVGQ